jgi:hypothetical protein
MLPFFKEGELQDRWCSQALLFALQQTLVGAVVWHEKVRGKAVAVLLYLA